MSERELLRRLQELEAKVLELQQQLGRLPVRIGGGGGAGELLPPGKGIYKILMRLDDLENGAVGWDYARFH
jgi:hypothetical protein